MDIQLPAPLVPHEVDLRGFPGFILDVNRLLTSEFSVVCSAEEFRAAVLLWCVSWQQSPPASLPDDDKILASFSRTGSKWHKVKAQALRGFVKCSDGRLYHKVLAQEANSSWERRKKFSDRGKKGNKSRWDKPTHAIAQAVAPESLCDPCAIAQAVAPESLCDRVEVKGSEVKETTYSSALCKPSSTAAGNETSARSQKEIPNTTPATQLAIELRKLGVQINLSHPALYEWLAKSTHAQVIEAVSIARTRKPEGPIPAMYLSPIIKDLVEGVKHETHRGSVGSTGAAIMASGFAQLNGR